jgi:hypothetical protein
MALEVNATPAGDYTECHRQPIDPRSNRAESLVHAYPLGILVNAQGQRFIDEAPNHRDGYLEEPLRALSRQPGGIAYFIFDRQIEHTLRSDQPAIEAPSLRELATKIGISPDTSKRRSPTSIVHVHRAPGTQASSTTSAPTHSCPQNPIGGGQSSSRRSVAFRSSPPTPLLSAG